jgi:hypothetical protein
MTSEAVSGVGKVEQAIRRRFAQTGSPAGVPMRTGGPLVATLLPYGVSVDNLASQPHLPWQVFEEAVRFIGQQGGTDLRGNAN